MSNLKSLKVIPKKKLFKTNRTDSRKINVKPEDTIPPQPEDNLDSGVTEEEFFSFLTHNIKNPFGTLLGFAEMLEMDFDMMDEDEKKFFVKQINSTAKNLYDAFENFVNWTFLSNGNYELEFEQVDLYDFVLEEVQNAKNKASKKNVNITVEKFGEEIKVNANRNLLSLALKNLLENAIKYSPENSCVKVKFTTDFNFVSVHIKDKGEGIDSSVNLLDYEGIVKTINQNKEKSVGLGLILSNKIIKVHNGNLWYNSTPEGSTFSFSLPKLK